LTSSAEDRAPFVARETEMTVLGACLTWGELTPQFAAEGLRESHFFSAHHKAVWRRLLDASREGMGGLPVVRMLLGKHGELEDVGLAYLASLGDGVPPPRKEHVRGLARRLIECGVGRETVSLLQRASTHLEERPAALGEGFFSRLDGSLRSLSLQLAGRQLPDHVSDMRDLVAEVRAALQAGAPDFIDTPWPALNNILGGGLAGGELVFLGARPGMGKTAAALEIARRAGHHGKSVFIVSREMRKLAIGLRMLSQEGPVHATAVRKRDFHVAQQLTIDAALERLEELPILVTHAELTVDDIRRVVGILADEAPVGLVVVDYLQLIDAPPGINERRFQVEAVSKGLKALTTDHNLPVLCLSSLARPTDNKAPTLASLRESGNLEHDADTVILLHRPQELEPKTHWIVAKSRYGRTGLVELFFRGDFLRFEDTTTAYGELDGETACR
jgi:replicative DNA helicase